MSVTLILSLIAIAPLASAAELSIRMPAYDDGHHEYFFDLLTQALEQDGHRVTLVRLSEFPQLRERLMLEQGDLDVLWLMHSEIRDSRFLPVPVQLTGGWSGKRVLLVPPAARDRYADIKNLSQFRQQGKTGGFGTNWFDVDVWEINNLPYLEVADWRLIYGMVAAENRGVDYFSRAFTEVVGEANTHPELAIEPHLLLSYDRDFIYYVSPKNPRLAVILEAALIRARDSGLIDKLIRKYWAEDFKLLKPESRTVIHLATPR